MPHRFLYIFFVHGKRCHCKVSFCDIWKMMYIRFTRVGHVESYVKLTQLAYYPECTIFFATVVSISQSPYNLSPLTLVKRIFTQFRFSILTKGTTKSFLKFSR